MKLDFGDLTLLVGEQGSGKSLALQWMKAALDGKHVVRALRDAGHRTDAKLLVDLVFGVGMSAAWRSDSAVQWRDREVRPENMFKLGREYEQMLFVPAHRAILISDGWATPFQKLSPDTPAVARMFSQRLFDRLNARTDQQLFPLARVLKGVYRRLIDEAVFHGGTIALEEDSSHTRRLKLKHADVNLPFMTWTAGQREFLPMMLGMYDVLVPRKQRKHPHINWVVIEEPEMGLHPHAIQVFMMLVLDLLWRGYRVVLSTHSPHVLTIVWALRLLQKNHASWKIVCDAFGVPGKELQTVAEAALTKSYKVHMLKIDAKDAKVYAQDISELDPDSDDEAISGWGGLTGYGSRFGDAVRSAINSRAR